uniref:Tuberin n=1 Tax=Petromyzon marinus TaxID=7757 RepID=A0AAJ7U2E4_PETMA|nr:tuberin isoform X1 [Petromyzon marinus]
MSKHPTKDSLKDKVKNLLGLGQNPHVKDIPEYKPVEFIITEDRLRDMNAENGFSNRIKAIKEMSDLVKTKRLEEHAVEALWCTVSDLLMPEQPPEARHTVLSLLKAIIQGQGNRLGILRVSFFRIVRDYPLNDDLVQRMEIFKALTDHGKDITYIDDDIGPFILQWMDETRQNELTLDFLYILVNIVKFNSSYLDQDKVAQIVHKIYRLCNMTNQAADIEASLRVLDAVVCYSCLPSGSLCAFIVTLCRTVNVKEFSEACWKLMRNLLGTHLGHSCVRTMCQIMESREYQKDIPVLRGAVFFVGMALWGAHRLPSLKNTPTSVLPSFLKAMTEDNVVVSYEIALSLTRLVRKYGRELQVATWDIVLDVIEKLVVQVQLFNNADFCVKVQDQLIAIEELHARDEYHGCVERYFTLVERCTDHRPARPCEGLTKLHQRQEIMPECQSVLTLLTYRAQSIHPAKDGWILELQKMMEKYFRMQTSSVIRKKCLEILFSVLGTHRHVYEEELMESVLIPHLNAVVEDREVAVRKFATQKLVELALTCSSSHFNSLLDALQKISSREMVEHTASEAVEEELMESPYDDIKTAVFGLLEILQSKLFLLPANHAVQVYEILIAHLQKHYRMGYNMDVANAIRIQVFGFLLSLRADSTARMGFVDKRGELRFSVYCLCDTSDVEKRTSDVASVPSDSPIALHQQSLPFRFGHLPFCRTFSTLLQCIQQEEDWKVLRFVLGKIPSLLQNKILIMSSQCSVDTLCNCLCKMVSSKKIKESNIVAGEVFSCTDLQMVIFPILNALTSYHSLLDTARQRELVQCLDAGLISRCAKQCVMALTMCVLEMSDIMFKMLPSILLKLTHISATVGMASSVLEFLSFLVRLPHLYTNFVAEQYISVFAISLPYTNSFKFTQYVVSLAHHVIAMWFIRCRLPFRKDFVQYITKGLRSNALLPFDEQHLRSAQQSAQQSAQESAQQNADQSNFRARSTSLSDKPTRSLRSARPSRQPGLGSSSPIKDVRELPLAASFRSRSISVSDQVHRRMETRLGGMTSGSMEENAPLADDSLKLVHLELTEICLDMIARFAFSNFSTMPKRSPAAEFLLAGGQTMSWLVGNKIITITTSAGAGPKSLLGPRSKDSQSSDSDRDGDRSPGSGQAGASKEAPGKLESQESQQPVHSGRVRQRSVSGGHALRACYSSDLSPLSVAAEPSGTSMATSAATGPGSTTTDTATTATTTSSATSTAAAAPVKAATPAKEAAASQAKKPKEKEPPRLSDCASMITQGWAEILIRRPTGNTCWMMKIENPASPYSSAIKTLPLQDLSAVLLAPDSTAGYPAGSKHDEPRDPSDPGRRDGENSEGRTRKTSMKSQVMDPDASRHHTLQRSNTVSGDCSPWQSSCKNKLSRSISWAESVVMEELIASGSKASSSPSNAIERFDDFHVFMPTSEVESKFMRSEPLPSLSIHGDGNEGRQRMLVSRSSSSSSQGEESLPTTAGVPIDRSSAAPGGSHDSEEEQLQHLQVLNKSSSSPELSTLHDREWELQVCAVELSSAPLFESSSPVADTAGARGSRDEANRGATLSPPAPATATAAVAAAAGGVAAAAADTEPALATSPSTSCQHRPRGHTISESASYWRRKRAEFKVNKSAAEKMTAGISPSFVFLQFYYSPLFGTEASRPILCPKTQAVERSIKMMDRIPPYDTHKIGVIYVGEGQVKNQTAMLMNEHGSPRYVSFVQGLGRLISLRDCDADQIYLGGLDTKGEDGDFAYCWHDDVMQTIFHVATLMPNMERDPVCCNKKRHVGNDFVMIVYNDSQEDYRMGIIRGQFNFVEVVIKPLDYECSLVTIQARKDLEGLIDTTVAKIVSDKNLPLLARQMALHANMASLAHQYKANPRETYASKWLARLRQMKRIRERVLEEIQSRQMRTSQTVVNIAADAAQRMRLISTMDDFSEFV